MALWTQPSAIRAVDESAGVGVALCHCDLGPFGWGPYSSPPELYKQPENPVSSDTDQAVADLQSQLAFQEDTLAALNDAVTTQQHAILLLQEEVALLKSRLREQGEALAQMGDAPGDERPPHY